MSALPPKADIAEHYRHVRFVPKADSCNAANQQRVLFDHLVGAAEQGNRHSAKGQKATCWLLRFYVDLLLDNDREAL